MAYHSNRIEGSRLTHEQTRSIFETGTITSENPVPIDDVVETVNHFKCFDYVVEHYHEPVSEELIKQLHFMLKSGTFGAGSSEAVIGDYKNIPIMLAVFRHLCLRM